MDDGIGGLLAEEDFPGNRSAFEALLAIAVDRRLTAFTGAGTSVPLAPAWSQLLTDLLSDGLTQGLVPASDGPALARQISDDPLELASTLEDLFTKSVFRSRLSNIFDLKEQCTDIHETLVRIPFESIVTLNYDDGLSTAYARATSRIPHVIRSHDTFEITRWQRPNDAFVDGRLPIVHWHGNINSPLDIIITADDYNVFYGRQDNVAFISELWRSRQVLAIGFGFKDPFLTRIAESALRHLPSDNQHFALIGIHAGQGVSDTIRRQFSKKYRLRPIFYKILQGEDGGEDHTALVSLLSHVASRTNKVGKTSDISVDIDDKRRGPTSIESTDDLSGKARKEFERNLLIAGTGRNLYVEPRLHQPVVIDGEQSENTAEVSVADILASPKSFAITCPFEYGGSTLAKRLAYELVNKNTDTHLINIDDLPDYKAKLQTISAFKRGSDLKSRVLILDNVAVTAHERRLKEIFGLKAFDRYILICRGQTHSSGEVQDLFPDQGLVPIRLEQLRREDIRAIAGQLYDTSDLDLVSAAVEKTYKDLLDLCIPLTPSNVIMYLSVINKEGAFIALNRLQIMDKYIRDLLQRPSDLYRDSFNIDNKIELLSSFIFHLFDKSMSDFSLVEWHAFCQLEMKRSLLDFDMDVLLRDLITSKIIVLYRGRYTFRYRLFYTYLLGKYVGERPHLLAEFIQKEAHLSIDGLVETIAGSSKDNTLLITSLVERLESSLALFEEQYEVGDLDPYRELDWAKTDDEEERVWRPVTEQLTQGPIKDTEVDKLKRSIMAEQRTADQVVIVKEFNLIERSVSHNHAVLMMAIRESPALDGNLKVRAVKALIDGYRMVMQIGFLFSPIIATRRYFLWNNIGFINMEYGRESGATNKVQAANQIAGAIPQSVSSRAIDELGSRRLGPVFKFLQKDAYAVGFSSFLIYGLLIRSKPEGWEASARSLIDGLDRRALYLRYFLSDSLKQFRQEVNTGADRMALKRLVAAVQAKRSFNQDKPSAKAVSGMLAKLEVKNYFESKAGNGKPAG